MDPQKQSTTPQQPNPTVGQGFASAFGAPQSVPAKPEEPVSTESSPVQETPTPVNPEEPPVEETPAQSSSDMSPTESPLETDQPSETASKSPFVANGPAVPPTGGAVASSLPGGMAPAKKKRPMVIAAIIIVLVLIGLVLVGLVFYQNYMQQFAITEQVSQEVVTPTVTAAPEAETVMSGDAELDQQSKAVDEQLNQLQNEVTETDQSASDSPDTLQ